MAGQVDDKQVLDAALIAAAQAVEHYEMTRYGGRLCNYPPGKPQKKLTDIAESQVNVEASMSP